VFPVWANNSANKATLAVEILHPNKNPPLINYNFEGVL